MNERIKQLLGQAYDEAVPETWTTLSSEQQGRVYEKFAELIIEECCNQLHDPNRYSDGDFAKWRIHQHFGLAYEPIHQ